MQYVRLGSTGLVVSKVCLGLLSYSNKTGAEKWREWILDPVESEPFIQRALELGINFFDTGVYHCCCDNSATFVATCQRANTLRCTCV